jgi:DNA-binding response OmpR family regulator
MPIINGLDLCKSVRQQAAWSGLPIIFLTAHVEPTLIQEVFSIGANDFVTKPVVGPEIISRITNLMERQQVQKLKAAERQRVNTNQAKSAINDQIAAALSAITEGANRATEQVASGNIHDPKSAKNDLQTNQSYKILQQVDILRQLLLNAQ